MSQVTNIWPVYNLTSQCLAENALEILRRADTARKQELLFATWDTDRDGFVCLPDIAEGLQKLRPSSDEIHLEFAAKAALKALPVLSSEENQRYSFPISCD